MASVAVGLGSLLWPTTRPAEQAAPAVLKTSRPPIEWNLQTLEPDVSVRNDGKISGRVLDASDTPIDGAEVEVIFATRPQLSANCAGQLDSATTAAHRW